LNYNNPVWILKSELVQFSKKKKKTNKLSCLQRESGLTFTLLFDEPSNAMILSKKPPRLNQFVGLRFWDRGERESEK
jgi:hypothetical protein